MTLKYKLFGVPGNMDEYYDKLGKKGSREVTISVVQAWERYDAVFDLYGARMDIKLRSENGAKYTIKGITRGPAPAPGTIKFTEFTEGTDRALKSARDYAAILKTEFEEKGLIATINTA